ncbi:putative porin [Paraburkholderia sp. GAS41]|uniref:hypothetical protein n=1 Tax=Paraburkholderia sp. GAS41 TaxID=3035134 RepID=UPI003D19D3D0
MGALAYRIGVVNLQFNYGYSQVCAASDRSSATLLGTANSFGVMEPGATILATASDTIETAATERDVRGVHENELDFQASNDHFISKRTSRYMRAGYIANNGSSTESWPLVTVSEPARSGSWRQYA